ncbi:MAG: cytochrome b [Pseudomonadota bacterium]|nr:cytochrome b [Pseudomonadota bacterium]
MSAGRSGAATYTRTAVVLHWLIAGMVLLQGTWGWWMQTIPKLPVGPRVDAYNLHKSIGLTILALVLVRLMWRLLHTPPPLPAMPTWQRRAARVNHVVLYLAIVAMPIVGYLGSAFSGYPVKYFGMTLPSWSAKHESLKELMSQVHLALSVLLTASVLLHIAAVVKHSVEGGSVLLARMSWSASRRPCNARDDVGAA